MSELPTREDLIAALAGDPSPTDEQIDAVFQITRAGYEHGLEGYYQGGDYSSDADWVYGVGADINRLENELDIDDGTIFDLYTEAHSAGLYERHNDPALVPLTAENSDDDPFMITLHAYHDEAKEWAEAQGYIGGDTIECDGSDFLYVCPCWHPGIFGELKKEGFVIDWSQYSEPEPADFAVAALLNDGEPCEGEDFNHAREWVEKQVKTAGALVIKHGGKAHLWHDAWEGLTFDTFAEATAFLASKGYAHTPWVLSLEGDQ